MDSKKYLRSYGWKEGEALQKNGIKKPILVKHKKDKKGIGHLPNGGADAWWERLFDGQLKGLDVQSEAGGVSFKQERAIIATGVSKQDSPLYRMFVRGETLQGTTGKSVLSKSTVLVSNTISTDLTQIKTAFKHEESIPKGHKEHKEKKDKKEKKERKEKMDKTQKKEKKEKGEKKDKKERKHKEVKEQKKKKEDRITSKSSSQKLDRDNKKKRKSKQEQGKPSKKTKHN